MDLLKAFQDMDFDNNTDEGMTLNSRVLIVDGLNTFIRSFCAIPTMDTDGNHIGGITGFLKSLGYVIRLHKPTRVFVIFDGAGGSQRRRKLYPDYKSNRKPITRLNRAHSVTTDKDDENLMKYELVLTAKALQNLPVTIISFDGVEADDIMAYVAHLTESKGGDSILYSTDKDFLQLINDSIRVWHPMTKVMYDTESALKKYEIHPVNYLLYRALTGDKSDNIPGVKGFGVKTALKHFPAFATSTKLTVDDIMEIAKDSKAVVMQRLYESKDIIDLNLILMQLSDVNMSGNNKISIVDYYNNPPPKFNKYELTKLLNEYNITPALGNYDSWVATSFNSLTRFHD